PDSAPDGGLGRMTTTSLPSAGFEVEAAARAEARAREARETPWALERRRAAAGVMKTLKLPSRLDELWRRTDFRTLEAALPELDPLVAGARARNLDDLPAPVIEALSGATAAYALVVQRDADVVLEQTHPDLERQGVVVCSLARAFREHEPKL